MHQYSDTLTSINNLVGVLRAQGQPDIAEKMHRYALEGGRKVLGKGHPFTRTCIDRVVTEQTDTNTWFCLFDRQKSFVCLFGSLQF